MTRKVDELRKVLERIDESLESKVREFKTLLEKYNGLYEENVYGEELYSIEYSKHSDYAKIEGKVFHQTWEGDYDFKKGEFRLWKIWLNGQDLYEGKEAIEKGIELIKFWEDIYNIGKKRK